MVAMERFIRIRRDLHQIPELGFEEVKTQNYILDYLQSIKSHRVDIKTWRTGVLVKIKGSQPERCIAFRCDMDGLPIKEETGFSFQSEHDGNMHACGHDFHMAIALGALTYFAEKPLKDDLLFVFQPAEEGPGGALPMLKSKEFNAWRPDLIFALHIAPEFPVGTIATKKGLLFANTSELFIDLTGIGGHAAYPHKANDMIVAASHLVTQLQTIISRNVDPLDSAVITVGKIESGTKQNIIAEHARLEGTIRTLSQQAMANVKKRIEALVSGIEKGFECQAAIDYGSNYYQVMNNSALTEQFIDIINIKKAADVVQCQAAMTGEDFGYFLKDIPGFMFWLGVQSEHGLHSARLNPDERAIEIGIRVIVAYLEEISQLKKV